MLKIKKMFKSCICYIVVLALLFSSVPIYSASASETANTSFDKLKEVASEVTGEQKEYAEEAVLDALNPNIGSDWGQAIFKDFLPWNYFHNAVQEHVASHVAEMTGSELQIALKVNKKGKVTKRGRADLYADVVGGNERKIRYLWEVKPASYKKEPNRSIGLAQLSSYVNAISENEINKAPEERSIHRNGAESGIKIPAAQFELGNYMVSYVDSGNGLILYRFDRKPDSNPETAVDYASAKDKAQDDIVHVATDTDLVINVVRVTAFLSLATGLMATHEPIAKTNTASAAIVSASAAFIAVASTALYSNTVNAAEVNAACDDFEDFIEAFYGEDVVAAYREAMETDDQDAMDEIKRFMQQNGEDYERAGEAQPPRDPLIVD